ncbi:MAG TPA: dual specificity protein phosphatase family protein [Solirubrobacteraceae bacterium]|nr:dual specificity protein phosphatase family protein [Solirubrobacteraceae bacterium]
MSRWFRSYGFADVFDDLIVGAYPLDQGDVDTLAHMGIDRVLNLTEDVEYRPGDREAVEHALADAGIAESRLPLTDYGGLPAGELEAAVRAVGGWLDDGERTYLHCRAGWQRSAAVAAGVVAIRAGIDIDEALDHVRRRKPSADPLPHQRADLRRWWESRQVADDPGSRVARRPDPRTVEDDPGSRVAGEAGRDDAGGPGRDAG